MAAKKAAKKVPDVKPPPPPKRARLMMPVPYDAAKIKFPTIAHPIMGGVRGILSAEGVRAKSGKLVLPCSHFGKAFTAMKVPDILGIEGVIIHPGMKDRNAAFAEMLAGKKKAPADVQFVVYDAVFEEEEVPFRMRYDILFSVQDGVIPRLQKKFPFLVPAPVYVARDPEEVDRVFWMFLKEGHAGAYYRDLEGWYVQKQTSTFREREHFEEFQCTLVVANSLPYGDPVIGCRLPNGDLVMARVEAEPSVVERIVNNWDLLQGRSAVVRCSVYKDDTGTPKTVKLRSIPGDPANGQEALL